MADSKKLKDEQLEDVAGGIRIINSDLKKLDADNIGGGNIGTGSLGADSLKIGGALDSSAAITTTYKCKTCGHTWEDAKVPAECPLCRSTDILAAE